MVTTGLLAAQPGGWIGAPSGDGGAAVPDAWLLPSDAAFAGLLPGYAFAQIQDSTPPTFVSSGFDGTALTITFSETIAAANVDPAKIHVRESGSYTGGITLTAGELGTSADADTISFALTESSLAAVKGLDTPELTIEPGAVRDTAGNPIVGTFDVSTATHIDAFDVSGNATSPHGMAFSGDGSKMFVVGSTADNVTEYTLTAPFDISRAAFTSVTFNVGEQEGNPRGMAFSSDGSKMFVVGSTADNVTEYTLTAPFDISTATFANVTFNVRTQDRVPTDMAFSSDGTKMFILGSFDDDVNEYTLTAPFDISTAAFTNVTFSVVNEEGNPQGMAFSSDGSKMFVVGPLGGNVTEYTLTAPFDISTAAFANVTFSVSTEDGTPTDMAFSSDGSKMFVVGSDEDNVNEYALSSVYPIVVVTSTPPPENAFVTTWEVETSPYVIHMPVEIRSGATATIDWGDGNSTTVSIDGTQQHTYADAGNYTVAVTGGLGRINLGESPSSDKLASLDQWGDVEWTTMKEAFREATNMVYNATGAPDLSGVTSMQNMFRDAEKFDGDISGWNVSGVANMDGTFRGASEFDGDLSAWDTSGATDMQKMFQNAISFDGDLSAWDTSGVAHMGDMFHSASAFNGNISGWNTSSVERMQHMFSRATAFTGDISGWDVSGVTNMDGMFSHTIYFNQNLSGWDVSNVTNMEDMFSNAQSFNGDISTWNVSSVTDMAFMFSGASSFNQPLDTWNVSQVTAMASMFFDATDFEQNLGTWYVVPADTTYDNATETSLNVTTMSAQNPALDGHTPNYDIGAGGNSGLFNMTGSTLFFKSAPTAAGAYTVNVTASGANLFGAGNHNRIFNVTVTDTNAAPVLDDIADQEVEELQPLAFTATASDDDAGDILVFSLAGTVPVGASIDENTGAFSWIPAADQSGTHVITVQVSDGEATDSEDVTVTVADSTTAFVTTWQTAGSGEDITIPAAGSYVIDWGDGTVESVSGTQTHTYATAGTYRVSIAGGLESIKMNDHLPSAPKLKSIEQWGAIGWNTMEGAFREASSMVYNATDAPDLSGVTSMQNMFRDAEKFDGDLSGWDVSGVANMDGTFRGASAFDGDLSAWDTSGANDTRKMFQEPRPSTATSPLGTPPAWSTWTPCSSKPTAFNSNISGWDVSRCDQHGQYARRRHGLQRRPLRLERL